MKIASPQPPSKFRPVSSAPTRARNPATMRLSDAIILAAASIATTVTLGVAASAPVWADKVICKPYGGDGRLECNMPPALSRADIKAAVLEALQEREEAARTAQRRKADLERQTRAALSCYIHSPGGQLCPTIIEGLRRPRAEKHITAGALQAAYEQACANRPPPQPAGCNLLYKDMWATLRLADEDRLAGLKLQLGNHDYQALRGCLDESPTASLDVCYLTRFGRMLPD